METFTAKHGTAFRYNADLSGEIECATRGTSSQVWSVPAEDFMEFAAHVAGLPPWAPEKDAYDKETTELMLAHVENCRACGPDQGRRCSKYWELILERVKEKERRAIQ